MLILEARKLLGTCNFNSLMNKKIISPCISICKTDPVTGYCYGCARTEDEKKILWKDEKQQMNGKKKLRRNYFKNERLAVKYL